MELYGYLWIVRRRKWVIIAATAAAVIIAVLVTAAIKPVYQATATVRVTTASAGSLDYINHDTNYTDRLINTYIKVATSAPMQAELTKRLGFDVLSTQVAAVPNTELMQITAQDRTPAQATQGANALADLLIIYIKNPANPADTTNSGEQLLAKQLTQAQTDLQKARDQYAILVSSTPSDTVAINLAQQSIQVKADAYSNLLNLYSRTVATQGLLTSAVSVIEPAVIPERPSQPRAEMNIGLGLVLGILSGIGLAFIFENLDTSLNTAEQIEQVSERSVLGSIPSLRRLENAYLNNQSREGEPFRQLRTSLQSSLPDSCLPTLLVTSATSGEGKSTVAANLAHAFGQTKPKVLLIDCNLRAPTLHRILDVPNEAGLSAVLEQTKTIGEVVKYSSKVGAWLVPSGVLPKNPADVMASAAMTELLQQAKQQFDIVILDAPSLLGVSDAAVLASQVDAVVLVVDSRHARQNTVKAACRVLEKSRAKSVGIVVNRVAHMVAYGNIRKRQPSG